jgi:hypothetical protein
MCEGVRIKSKREIKTKDRKACIDGSNGGRGVSFFGRPAKGRRAPMGPL